MKPWIPLFQTLCWIILIVWLLHRFKAEVAALVGAVQKRIERGSSLKAGPFELGELDIPPSKPNAAAGPPSEAQQPPPSAKIPGVQHGVDPQHTFLLRSSWHGLKILKACKWASQGNRLLKLRELANVGSPMAYDYAFGFLVAAFSADLAILSANPQSGHIVVASVHPTVDSRIDDFLEGYIAAHGAHADALRDDLNALLAYLKGR